MPSIVWYIFGPTASALFDPSLLWSYRWRLLLLQPLIFLTITLIKIPYLLSPPFTTTSIPNRHGLALRTLIYLPKRRKDDRLSPLHISFHAGAFIGGFPETQAHFSKVVVEKTGAVVVAPHTRYAPRHVFPAMIEDAEDAVKYCLENCERLWGADPRCVTTDGFSAGGNLAVAVCQDALVRKAVKGVVTFYGVMDLRIPPWEKPRPDNFPKNDPMSVFLPLYDSYAGPERSSNMSNPRLSPIVSEIENLPPRMLMVVPSIDILVHEQLTMAERVSREIKEKGLDEERSCEARIVEGAFHGWLELPYLPADLRAKKDEAFGMAIDHLRDIHQRNGWHWSPE